jgi:hypothetical protein
MPFLKPRPFETRHIKILIKPPSGKELDMNDEFDIKIGMRGIWDEWQQIQDDVNAMFRVFKINETTGKDKFLLP